MKDTRSIQLAATAAMFIGVMAWGENSPAPTSGGSTGPLLAAVGEGSGGNKADSAMTAAADQSISATPVEISHSQQRVTNFLDQDQPAGTAGADQILLLANRMFDIILTLGGGYDSNPRLENKQDGEG
jgi:hypothetical protein